MIARKLEPTVSIYLPTQNRADLLPRAITSVLTQSHSDFELIVVDDASSDHTPEVIQEFARTDDRVSSIRFATRVGAPAARNAAIESAKGRFITGIDDDDEMRPKRLTELLEAFRPEYSLISSSAIRRSGDWSMIAHPGDETISLDRLLYRNIVGTQVLTLRERLIVVGGFDVSFQASQDYDLWIRLVQQYGPAKRISSPSYILNEDPALSRISDRRLTGAEQILAKHGSLMHRKHIQSRRLEMLMMSGETLSFRDTLELANSENFLRAGRYFLTCRAPMLRQIARHARRKYAPKVDPDV